MTKSEVFFVYTKQMAMSVRFITGKDFHKRDGINGTTVYTFLDCEEVRNAVEEVMTLRKKFRSN